MSFWRFFKRGYSSTISITVNLGNFNMVKISQTAPNYQNALGLLIDSCKELCIDVKTKSPTPARIEIENYIHEVFGLVISDEV